MHLPQEKRDWFTLLAKSSKKKQHSVICKCDSKFIRDLHRLIRVAKDNRKAVFSEKDKRFFKKNKDFLRKFVKEKSIPKKRKQLLRKVSGAGFFLGALIPALISLVSSIPSLISKSC